MSQATQTTLATALDEINIRLQQQGPAGPDGVAAFSGASGTVSFATAVVRFLARMKDTANWAKIGVFDRVNNVAKSGDIALTDNTAFDFFIPNALMYSDAKMVLVSIGSGNILADGESCPAAFAPITVYPAVTVASTPQTITSTSATALVVGANGATNPVLQIDANTASVATGLKVTGAAAAGRVALAVISSGTNEGLDINAKGSGTIRIGNSSTGNVLIGGGGGIAVLSGTLTAGGLLTCALQVATSGPLIYSGSGAPSISAAVKGSIYLRTDGSSTSTRLYVATDTAGTWTPCTTAA